MRYKENKTRESYRAFIQGRASLGGDIEAQMSDPGVTVRRPQRKKFPARGHGWRRLVILRNRKSVCPLACS